MQKGRNTHPTARHHEWYAACRWYFRSFDLNTGYDYCVRFTYTWPVNGSRPPGHLPLPVRPLNVGASLGHEITALISYFIHFTCPLANTDPDDNPPNTTGKPNGITRVCNTDLHFPPFLRPHMV